MVQYCTLQDLTNIEIYFEIFTKVKENRMAEFLKLDQKYSIIKYILIRTP